MIPNEEEWYYLTVKKLSVLLIGVISKIQNTNKEKVFENKDFCKVVMASENTKVLEFNHYDKYDKEPDEESDIDLQSLTKNIECKNYLEKSSTTKVGEHNPSGFPMPTISWFKKRQTSMMYPDIKIVWRSFVNL